MLVGILGQGFLWGLYRNSRVRVLRVVGVYGISSVQGF